MVRLLKQMASFSIAREGLATILAPRLGEFPGQFCLDVEE